MVTDRRTDRQTDRPTDIAIYRAAIAANDSLPLDHIIIRLFYYCNYSDIVTILTRGYRPTDRPTDRPTLPRIELLSQLKIK